MPTYSENILFPVVIYLSKVDKNTRKWCEICPKFTHKKTPKHFSQHILIVASVSKIPEDEMDNDTSFDLYN